MKVGWPIGNLLLHPGTVVKLPAPPWRRSRLSS